MTDFTKLIDWYENRLDLDFDDFGDLSDSEIQDTLINFGIDKSTRNTPISQLEYPLERAGRDIFDVYFINKISNANDLKVYGKLIDERHEPILAKREGSRYATEVIDRTGSRDKFEEAVEWLREYHPQKLGFIKGIKTYREKAQGFRLVFG